MDKEWLIQRYLVEHLTMEEIARESGCSRQNVRYWVRKHGIEVEEGTWVGFKCDQCGKDTKTTRKRFKGTVRHFCGFECYREYLRGVEYRNGRIGQRLARIVMEESLGRELVSGEVICHLDGNSGNNELSNLMLFNSSKSHVAFHHKRKSDEVCRTGSGSDSKV